MLNTLMKNWGDSYTKQANLIETDMKEFFNYIQDEFLSYKEVSILIPI